MHRVRPLRSDNIRLTDVGPEPQKHTRRAIIGAGNEDDSVAFFEQLIVPHGTQTFLWSKVRLISAPRFVQP